MDFWDPVIIFTVVILVHALVVAALSVEAPTNSITFADGCAPTLGAFFPITPRSGRAIKRVLNTRTVRHGRTFGAWLLGPKAKPVQALGSRRTHIIVETRSRARPLTAHFPLSAISCRGACDVGHTASLIADMTDRAVSSYSALALAYSIRADERRSAIRTAATRHGHASITLALFCFFALRTLGALKSALTVFADLRVVAVRVRIAWDGNALSVFAFVAWPALRV